MTTLPPDLTLELFGQQSSAALSTPFLFCYPMNKLDDVQRIVERLEAGRHLLDQDLPWTSGEVIRDRDPDEIDSSGSSVFKIRYRRAAPRVIVKDWRSDPSIPSMRALQERDFPASMLDEAVFSPFDVLPDKESQAALSGHHQALDGTGQEQVIYWLNKACHGQRLTDEETRIGNLPRDDIVELFPDDWQPQNSRYLKPTVDDNSTTPSGQDETAQSRLVWTNVCLSGESHKELKKEAHRDIASGGFVSTDDALTGLIWQSLCRARSSRLSRTTRTTLGRAVNPRRYLNIPATYPGYISNMTYTTKSLDTMVESTLGEVTTELHAAVDPERSKLSEVTREFATLIHRARDKDSVSLGNCLDLDHDLMVSSWAGMRCHEFDFDMGLGLPVAFRRTRMAPVPNLLFLLPKDAGGNVVSNMCIRQDDLGRLQRDEGFTRYGRFIG